MISIEIYRELALSFPNSSEAPHFENIAFKVGKKIFGTYNPKFHRACLKLSETQQYLFSSFDKNIIYPVPNKFGKNGWTLVDLSKISEEMFTDALKEAYCEVAPKKYVEQVKGEK